MDIKTYGSSDESIAIVGGTHGDEPMTAEVIDDFYSDLKDEYKEDELNLKVKFIIANEPALQNGVRYTDTDLNRSFPGNKESDLYEERLASDLMSKLENVRCVLSIHSSYSTPPPFAITSHTESEMNKRTLRSLPVKHVVDTKELRQTTLDANFRNTVTIEAGKPNKSVTKNVAYKSIENYLEAHGVFPHKSISSDEKILVRAKREIDKSHGKPNVHYGNFERVPEGETIAEDSGVQHVSTSDNTVPVLISEHGYEDIFGLVGKEIGKL